MYIPSTQKKTLIKARKPYARNLPSSIAITAFQASIFLYSSVELLIHDLPSSLARILPSLLIRSDKKK